MNIPWRALACVATLAIATGCASAPGEDEVLAELANLDKTAIYEQAEALYQDGKYEKARKYFSFLYDTFPNDPLGHKAALRVADSYAVRKDSMSLTEARLRYRDFANRYPNDPDRDYALLMLGHTYTSRKLHPDRDLSAVEEAMGAYQQLVNLYPDSAHVEEAREQIARLRATLAEHEWLVAKFYVRNKRWRGCEWRLEYLQENYPDYPHMDQVTEALARCREGVEAREAEIERWRQEQMRAFEGNVEEESAEEVDDPVGVQ